MTLSDLLDVIDFHRESEIERVQICRPSENWEYYDECSTSSALLVPFYDCEVKCIGAIEADVIRVDLDWSAIFQKREGEQE